MAASIGGLVSYSESDSDDSSSNELASTENDGLKRKRKYSTSKEDVENNGSPSTKYAKGEKTTKGRLPVPDGIVNMFSQTQQHVDLPEEHGGRVRSFAHERGNWASFVYADVEPDSHLCMLAESLSKCLRHCGDFTVQKELHLSLSRTFVLRHHWIDSLLTSLKSNMIHHSGCSCVLHTPNIYCNDENTRTFLGIQVTTSIQTLHGYVADIDKSLKEFRLPEYYKEPSFHISLAWAVGDIRSKISSDTMELLQMTIDDFFVDNPTENILTINNLNLKTGNKIFHIPLKKS